MEKDKLKILRLNSIFILVGLIVQYIFGMYANLFVSFPEDIEGGKAWEFAWSEPILGAHIILGALLLIGSVAFIIRVFIHKNNNLKTTALLGLVSVLLAGVSGEIFVSSQMELYSYSMSLFFIIALLSYGYSILAVSKIND